MLTSLFMTASSILVDVVIALVIIEMVLLFAATRRRGRSVQLMTLANSAAGLCLLLALRSALQDSGPEWIVLALTGALLAHLADLGLRRKLLPGGAGREISKSETTPT
ncbi:MAG: hypothetical protein P8X98_01860 [Woeseiaceae bacterium]